MAMLEWLFDQARRIGAFTTAGNLEAQLATRVS
jgi:hypothetical protein